MLQLLMKSVQTNRKGKKDSRQLFKMKISCPAKYLRKKLEPILHELLTSKKKWMRTKITQ